LNIPKATCDFCKAEEVEVYINEGYKKYCAHDKSGDRKAGRCEMSDHRLPNQAPPKYVPLVTARPKRPIAPLTPRDEFEALFPN